MNRALLPQSCADRSDDWCWRVYRRHRPLAIVRRVGGRDRLTNPFRLRPAPCFGAVFAIVLLVSQSANTWFGDSGIYVTAFLSGLADVDAITLTLSALEADGETLPESQLPVSSSVQFEYAHEGRRRVVLGTVELLRRYDPLGAVAAAGIVVVVL